MASDRLYDLAVRYRKAKLWKDLTDDALFGVRLANGEIGYCSVMGMMGEHFALGVYRGREGLDSYRLLAQITEELPDSEIFFRMLSQDCLQCSFETKGELSPEELEETKSYGKRKRVSFRGQMAFPRFQKYRPYYAPAVVKDTGDEELLCLALEAAIAIAERAKKESPEALGFTYGAPFDREIPLLEPAGDGFRWSMLPLPERREIVPESPALSNEILLGKIKRMKKRGERICELFMFPVPTELEDGSGLCSFPVVLIALDPKSGMVLPDVMDLGCHGGEALLASFATALAKAKSVPSSIYVRNERAYLFLENFCKQAGIQLYKEDSERTDILDEIEEDLMSGLDGFPGDGLDVFDDADEFDDMDGIDEIGMLSAVAEMIGKCSDKEIREMPEGMKEAVRAMLGQGLFSPSKEKKLKKLLR